MVLALKTLALGGVGGILDDVISFGNGFIDGYVILKSPLFVIFKNIIVVVLGRFMGFPLPKALVNSAETMLGYIVGLLLSK